MEEEASQRILSLRNIPLFSALSEEELYEIAKRLKVIHIENDQTIIQEGEESSSFYILWSGEVDVMAKNRMIVRLLKKGEYFGEISLIGETKPTATVKAATDVSLLCLDKDSFSKALERHPKIREHIERHYYFGTYKFEKKPVMPPLPWTK
ncbi:MAG: cyclic nucleotide-binding domain-containing protein [Candidatus Desantisbacteria bacterium]